MLPPPDPQISRMACCLRATFVRGGAWRLMYALQRSVDAHSAELQRAASLSALRAIDADATDVTDVADVAGVTGGEAGAPRAASRPVSWASLHSRNQS